MGSNKYGNIDLCLESVRLMHFIQFCNMITEILLYSFKIFKAFFNLQDDML